MDIKRGRRLKRVLITIQDDDIEGLMGKLKAFEEKQKQLDKDDEPQSSTPHVSRCEKGKVRRRAELSKP